MKNLLFLLPILFFQTSFSQEVITKYTEGYKTVYIVLEKNYGISEIWSRSKPGYSTGGDVKILTLETKVENKKTAMDRICKGKKYFDTGKTIAGCASVAGSAICLATGGGGGVGVPVCVAVVSYTASSGLVDCLSGITTAIGNKFNNQDFKNAGSALQGYSGPSVSSLISISIDEACDDWKRNK